MASKESKCVLFLGVLSLIVLFLFPPWTQISDRYRDHPQIMAFQSFCGYSVIFCPPRGSLIPNSFESVVLSLNCMQQVDKSNPDAPEKERKELCEAAKREALRDAHYKIEIDYRSWGLGFLSAAVFFSTWYLAALKNRSCLFWTVILGAATIAGSTWYLFFVLGRCDMMH